MDIEEIFLGELSRNKFAKMDFVEDRFLGITEKSEVDGDTSQ